MKLFKSLLITGLLALLFSSCNNTEKSNKNYQAIEDPLTREYAIFDNDNNLLRPKGYRQWVFAGANTTPKSLDADVLFPDFQNVYIDPAGYQYWKENGKWKEGTIFVKELLRKGDTISPVAPGGNAFYQGAHYSVSAMVKDTKRFPDMHNGWNYFRFVDKETLTLTPKGAPQGNKCASCHIPNALDGDVFYQYYPVILAAKGVGKEDPENANTREGLNKGYQWSRPTSAYLQNLKNH